MRNINEIIDFDSRKVFIAVASESIKGKMYYSKECNKKLLKEVIKFCNEDVIKYLGECSYHDTAELFEMAYKLLNKSNMHIVGKCKVNEMEKEIATMRRFIELIKDKV